MNRNMKMITAEKEGKVLFRLALPMVAGILGMIVFNLVDTFFVGKLGTLELAALSFTFPVVMTVSSVALGLGVGMTAAVSKATGRNDGEGQIRLVTHGMIFSFVIVLFFVIAGQLTIDPVFRLLGADEATLPVIREYMRIWYWGVIFVVVPMTGNSAIRGMGDTRTPGLVMILAAIINSVMDPLLIFGIGPFPRMGVAGAATATVAARCVTFFTAVYILGFRDRVFSISIAGRKRLGESLKEILYVGVPNILTRIIIPLGAGIITGLIARHGREAVAGFGVATRLEMFALLFIQALVAILPVFIGQNWGAGRKDRVERGLGLSERYSVGIGLLLYIILALFAHPLGTIFNRDPAVVGIIVLYLRIVPVSYGLRGVMLLGVTSLNVLKRPVQSAVLTLVQMFVIYIPSAFAGSILFGPAGIFGALALSYIVMGPVTHFINRKYILQLPCG